MEKMDAVGHNDIKQQNQQNIGRSSVKTKKSHDNKF